MEVMPGYKQTEVGVIPGEWEVMPLSLLAALPVQNGVFNEPSRKGRGCKLINVIDLYSDSPINTSDLERFDATKDEIARFGVADGDLFFTRSSLTPDGIAHCNIYRQAYPEYIVFDCHLIRVRANTTKADPFFLATYCTSQWA
jgi:type I restriction enzyme, S subunit